MNSNSTEQKIDALYDLLYGADGEGYLQSRMRLAPDPSVPTYFEAAQRPVLTQADMERITREGVASELNRLLADVPTDRRSQAIELIEEIMSELSLSDAQGDEAPSALIYAMH